MKSNRLILCLALLSILACALPAQQDFWDRDPTDIRAGLNNGLRKLFLHLEAKKGQIPLLRFRSRIIDQENVKKEIFGDLVHKGRYVYEGSERVARRGNDYIEHRFAMTGSRRIRVALDIKGIEAATLRDLVRNGFDVAPDRLPYALVFLFEGTRVLTYPLRDISKWKGHEEKALLSGEVPMEKTADRLGALRYAVQKLAGENDRKRRLEGLKQIAFYDNEEIDPVVVVLLRLREDADPVVAKAVREFCLARNLYSQQEMMKALFGLRGDDREKWLVAIDLLEKIAERDAARDGAPALKHFLRDKKPGSQLARRAEAKLSAYRKILPPGAEDAPLPEIGPETGWLPTLEPLPVSRPNPPREPEIRPTSRPASRPADSGKD